MVEATRLLGCDIGAHTPRSPAPGVMATAKAREVAVRRTLWLTDEDRVWRCCSCLSYQTVVTGAGGRQIGVRRYSYACRVANHGE